MEKKLLLLGLLLSQEMHGYQLNEMLQHGPADFLQVSKANAYRILKTMEGDGWVEYHEEQEGNRPHRKVYAITESGKESFFQLLRDNLRAFSSPEFPGVVGLDFMHVLPTEEVIALLGERREAVIKRFTVLDEMPEEARETHLSLAYLHSFYASEMRWLAETIDRLKTED